MREKFENRLLKTNGQHKRTDNLIGPIRTKEEVIKNKVGTDI